MIQIVEAGRFQIKEIYGIRKSRVHRTVVIINGRTFKRLYDPNYPPACWLENGQDVPKQQSEELEAILKAFILDTFNSTIENYEQIKQLT